MSQHHTTAVQICHTCCPVSELFQFPAGDFSQSLR